MSTELRELSAIVNAEARRHYPELARMLGESSLASAVSPHLALRRNTPYPYTFKEAVTLIPDSGESFGRVVRRGREEGLEEIHGSIGEQDKEHQWLYIPEESIWVDTTLSADGANVNSDQYVEVFLSRAFSEVEAVHTHPDKTVRDLSRELPWQYSENYLLEAALPSTQDLTRHAQMNKRSAAKAQLTSSIVSHYGVTSYSLASTGEQAGLFQSRIYDRLIRDSLGDPAAIPHALGIISAHTLLYDGTPAFSMQFEPLR